MALFRIFPFNPNVKVAFLYRHMESLKTFLYNLISKIRRQEVQIIAKHHWERIRKETVNSHYGRIDDFTMSAYLGVIMSRLAVSSAYILVKKTIKVIHS